MIFQSKLQGLSAPTDDVFNYVFSQRNGYPRDRVLYRMDHSDGTLTLEQLEEQSRQFASVLVTAYSIKPGDVVAILASDTVSEMAAFVYNTKNKFASTDEDKIDYPIVYFGILAAGAIVELIPIQKELTLKDVVARLTCASATLLVTNQPFSAMADQAKKQMDSLRLLDLGESSSRLQSLIEGCLKYDEFHLKTAKEAESHTAFINRTSGSTGNMKSALTTHAHFIAVLESTRCTIPTNTDPERDIWLSSISLGFFINAKLHMGLNILLGIPVVLIKETFDHRTLDVIERHRITFLFLAPPVAADIAKDGNDSSSTDVSSIKWLLTAGAPIHEGLQRAVSKKLNGVHLDLEWGTSETLLIAIQMEGHASPVGSCGVLVNGMEAKVIDTSTGDELQTGERGEILVRNAACQFAGYKNNDGANKAAFDSEGWYHSGDFGFLDSNCNVFIMDRLKELIRVGEGYGVHISATEVEAVLFEHEAVAQVIVTGAHDVQTVTDRPTAFIVLKQTFQDQPISALESIERFARAKLHGLQQLTGGIVFLPRFPLVSFKVDRRALRTLASIGSSGVQIPRYIEYS